MEPEQMLGLCMVLELWLTPLSTKRRRLLRTSWRRVRHASRFLHHSLELPIIARLSERTPVPPGSTGAPPAGRRPQCSAAVPTLPMAQVSPLHPLGWSFLILTLTSSALRSLMTGLDDITSPAHLWLPGTTPS